MRKSERKVGKKFEINKSKLHKEDKPLKTTTISIKDFQKMLGITNSKKKAPESAKYQKKLEDSQYNKALDDILKFTENSDNWYTFRGCLLIERDEFNKYLEGIRK